MLEDSGKAQEAADAMQEEQGHMQEEQGQMQEEHGKMQEEHGKMQEVHGQMQEEHGRMQVERGQMQEHLQAREGQEKTNPRPSPDFPQPGHPPPTPKTQKFRKGVGGKGVAVIKCHKFIF